MLLSGRVAIITGASKGIGRVMSQLFAREGARVVCVARSAALVEETAAAIRHDGGDAIAVVADTSREEEAARIVDETVHAFGPVNALVNNAGDSGPTKAVQEYSTAEFLETLNSSLVSAFLCVKFAAPFMIEAGGGAIVNISSMAARRGLPFRVGYCSAKAGQIGMTYGLALELGPHNITVNAIAPGAVAGDRIERVVAAGGDAGNSGGRDAEDVRRPVAAQTHVDRRRHRIPRSLSLQRHGEKHFGTMHSGDGGRTIVRAVLCRASPSP